MIYELLAEGAENAKTGRELAAMLNCDIRNITETIERERRQGKPICANMRGENAGYYLAASPEELEAYCGKLHHRAAELYKTRRALLNILKQLPGVTVCETAEPAAEPMADNTEEL